MGIALIHVDYGGKDVFGAYLCLEKLQCTFKIAAYFFFGKFSQKFRGSGDNGVNEFYAVLAAL